MKTLSNQPGVVVYLVGGSVRDFFLGRQVEDFDLVTSALPDQICELFPGCVTVGKAFGVIRVPSGSGNLGPFVEVATFRKDLASLDHRHPLGVEFSGIENDSLRRDFTMNALFYDPKTGRYWDGVGGKADLSQRLIKTVGDPELRMKEDALRLLRAVRFQAALDFTIEQATADAILKLAKGITYVSAERIAGELSRMWLGARPERALQSLVQYGLLPIVLPELHKKAEAKWAVTLRRVRWLAQEQSPRSLALAWAAVLMELGAGGEGLKRVLQRLKFAKVEAEKIDALIGCAQQSTEVFQMREVTLQRWVRHEHFVEILALIRAEAMAVDGNLAHYEFAQCRWAEAQAAVTQESEARLTGADLIALGLLPGPLFAEILEQVSDQILAKKIQSKREALEYVLKNFVT